MMLAGAFVLVVGCGDDDGSPPCFVDGDAGLGEVALVFTDLGGNYQTGFVGQSFGSELRVRLVDAVGAPRVGVEIGWEPELGPRFGTGTVSVVSGTSPTLTDEAGEATLGLFACDEPGGVTIGAAPVDGSTPPVRFRLTCFPQPGPGQRPLTVVHFNDFHTHVRPWKSKQAPLGGIARLSTLVQTLRANAEAAGVSFFAANSGDDFENTMIGDVPGALAETLVLQDRMGVDVFQVGNHDSGFGVVALLDVLEPAAQEFTDGIKGHPLVYLFGNVDPSTLYEPAATLAASAIAESFDATDALLKRTWVLDDGSLRVGVIGAVTDVAIYTQVPGDPAFFDFLGLSNPDAQGLTFLEPDPRESDYFAEGLDHLDAEDVDFIVCTSHTGLGVTDRVNLPPGYDHLIAEYAQGAVSGRVVDTVLSAHSHVKVNHAIGWDNPAGGKTTLIQADEGGLFLTRQDFVVDTTTNTAELIDSRLLQVDRHLVEDADAAAVVVDLVDRADQRYPGSFDTQVAYNERVLSSRIEAPCGLGRLIARSFLDSLNREGIDVGLSLAVPSLYRVDVEAGAVTPSDLFDVLPLHKMDDRGTVNDTITYLELKPGLWDVSFFGIDSTERLAVPAVLYLMELMYGVFEVLGDIYPSAARQLNVSVVQFEGGSFDIDMTAPPMHRIDPDSFRIGGEPLDPDRTYRVALMESLASVAGPLMELLVWSERSDTGQAEPMVTRDPETELYYYDSHIPLWESLRDYVTRRAAEGCGAIPYDDLETDGEIRYAQPDVTLRHTTMFVSPRAAAPGEVVTVSVDLTNYGRVDVRDVRATLYYDTTPWDETDNPDGLEVYEGLAADDRGSYVVVDEQWVSVPRWPADRTVRFDWTLPADLKAYRYPLYVRLTDISSDEVDPNTGMPFEDIYPGNNGGDGYPIYLSVTR
jgi:2',3'-cyclic-nucleotide 2'-phosphodiesterase (5'-nucleotidase family)